MRRFLLLLLVAGCVPAEYDEPDDLWADGKADAPRKLAWKNITKATQSDEMAFAGGVAVQGPSVKFLIDHRDPAHPTINFQNAQYKENGRTPLSAQYHFYFAQAVLPNFAEDNGSFNDATYYHQEKRYFAGTVQAYELDGGRLYGIQFYPEDVVAESTIVEAIKVVKRAFRVPNARMAFVATGPQQTTATVADQIIALGMENTSVDKVLGSVKYLPMNLGEAWGYLRIFPANADDLSPMDIPVFDELPLDLAVVAGVITHAFQDASAHVNLKSKERGTPDMVLRDAGPSHAQLAPFADRPVHLVVRIGGFTVEASTAEVVRQKLAERMNKPWVPLAYESDTRLLGYAEMCASRASDCIPLSRRFGSKAANLGLMTNREVLGRTSDANSQSARLGYDLVPEGFGVPIRYYHDFVAHAPNSALRTKLDALITAEKAGMLSPSQRNAMLKEVQLAFYAAEQPPGVVDAIKARMQALMPGLTKFKVRSSANAEDLPNFDGAGLYDSFSANLSKTDNADGSCTVVATTDVETKLEMSPKTLNCAIKGVYASVWNKRAIEERSFARLDHATAGMGLAVVPKYDTEAPVIANSVVVTRALGAGGILGYTFSTQKDNNLVTNPTPGTLSENVIAAFSDPQVPPTFTVTRFATPVAGQPALTTTVLARAQMVTMLDVVKQVETAYCRAKPTYYEGDCRYVTFDPDKPTALDLEFKILEGNKLVAKQVREFAGR